MIRELLSKPELATATALVVALMWLALAFWLRLRPVGDDLAGRLDELAEAGIGDVTRATPVDRYARFSSRDYSSDRGVVPTGPPPVTARWGALVVPRWTDFYAELVERLGTDPLGGQP